MTSREKRSDKRSCFYVEVVLTESDLEDEWSTIVGGSQWLVEG
jgi:hypothetical protein